MHPSFFLLVLRNVHDNRWAGLDWAGLGWAGRVPVQYYYCTVCIGTSEVCVHRVTSSISALKAHVAQGGHNGDGAFLSSVTHTHEHISTAFFGVQYGLAQKSSTILGLCDVSTRALSVE